MLSNVCEPEFRRHGIDLLSVWLQQDGATTHTTRASRCILREIFPQHVISRSGDVPWPERSPDLSACDSFYGGISKAEFSSLSLET
jgi:hypothetical protein